jgi:hypothetical protein
MKPASFDTAEWIDAWRDRRPMTDDAVLVSGWDGDEHVVGMSCYANGYWATGLTVLAWMPLPEAYDPVEAAEKLPSGIFIDGESVRFIK